MISTLQNVLIVWCEKMKRKAKTDYSLLIIMLPFCLIFELGKLAFSILGTILNAAAKQKPKIYREKRYIPDKIPKPKAEQKQKQIDFSKIEKYQSEIRKSRMLINHYNELLECQINLYREELYKDKPKENRLITLNNSIASTKCKLETEKSKIKQYRIKLKQIRN